MEVNFRKRDYLITTIKGAIPYIINDSKPFLHVNRTVLIDDFLFKDSYYERGGDMEIHKYVGSTINNYVLFKETPKILKSKRGFYKLNQNLYNEVIARMKPAGYANFVDGKLIINGIEFIEPKDFEDFKKIVKKNEFIIGTEFINTMILKGETLKLLPNNELEVVEIKNNENDYIKYLYSIKEMNGFTLVSENNYKVLYDYFNIINK